MQDSSDFRADSQGRIYSFGFGPRLGSNIPQAPYASEMQDLGIAVSRPVDVARSGAGPRVFLTFHGLSDRPHQADRDFRVRVTMPIARAAEFRRQLADVTDMPEAEPTALELVAERARDYLASFDAQQQQSLPRSDVGTLDTRELAALRAALTGIAR